VSRRLPFLAQWRNEVRDGDLDRTAKLVAYTPSTYIGTDGKCWPSKETLAADCGIRDGPSTARSCGLSTPSS
jgi:hypothetical protein